MRAKFYAKAGNVYQAPQGQQMGFLVCECSAFVEGADNRIVAALNFLDRVAGMPLPKSNIEGSSLAVALIGEAKTIVDD